MSETKPRSKKRLLIKIGVGLVVLLLLLQLIPVERDNPPVEEEVVAPKDVQEILRRSCYDCHSNETRWPWYSEVAPASFLVAHDVDEGRGELNFSTWNQYDADRRAHKLHEVVEQLEEDEMPLWIYRPLHPEADLSEDDKAKLIAWAKGGAKR